MNAKNATALMDVIAPPANLWLRKLARRKAELPECVRIVRFGSGEDDLPEVDSAEQAEVGNSQVRGKRKLQPAFERGVT